MQDPRTPSQGAGKPTLPGEVFARSIDAALADAAARGRTAEIGRLVAEGADVDAVGRRGVTPLLWALVHDRPDGMEALLHHGADSARLDEDGESAAHIAARAKNPALLRVLVEAGGALDLADARIGRTPLFEAIMADQQPQFEALLAAGVDLDAADNLGNTPLHTAAKIKDYARTLQLLAAGADAQKRNGTGATFQRYLAIGPNPALVSTEAREGKADITHWLRDHGVAIEGEAGR